MNLEFSLEEESSIVFQVDELDARLRSIHERALYRAKKYLVSEAELLESIIEVDQHKLYEKFGLQYLTPYCVTYMGLDETVAGVFVRIARKSQIIPELKQAIVDNEISISNARTIASVITNQNQAEWIEKAKTLSKNKLEREVTSVSPSKAKPEKARHLGNGRVQLVLNLSEEEYEQRCRIKDPVSQSLGKSATDSEVEVAMMSVYQFHKDPVCKTQRAAEKERKCKERAASQDVSPQKKDLRSKNSRGLRNIPAHVKHAVNLRDRGQCQARHPDGTICRSTRWVHYHHIIPKCRGGNDTPENIISLCSAHHRLWHKREDASERVQKCDL
jgi:5-methylcytosine-specific restriction endonuclease McrA